MEPEQREEYRRIAGEILRRAPGAPAEAEIWRRTLLLAVQDAAEGDPPALAWLGSRDCRRVIRLAGLPVDRTLDILVDNGLLRLGKAA